MRTPPITICLAGLASTLVLGVSTARAQSGQTAQIPLAFSYLEPGARSLGMGSAFTAVADDATAAYTNPAGLTFIVRKEVSAELRYSSLDTTFLSGGRLTGTPSGQGIDTAAGPLYGTSSDSSARPYFVSFVYPAGRWSIAGYRHELVRQSNSFLSQGPFFGVGARFNGLTGSRDIVIDNYGGAVAVRVSPMLSLGVNLSVYHFSDSSSFATVLAPSFFAAVNPVPPPGGSTTTQTGSSTKVAANAGAIVKVNANVRVGVVWRQGVAVDFDQVETVPAQPTLNETGQFRTPNVFGAGVRAQVNDEFAVAIDDNWVQYSRLTKDFIAFQVPPPQAGVVGTAAIPNGNEVHVGAEYTLTHANHTPSLRAGVWYDPDHAVQYTPVNTNSTEDVLLKAAFPAGSATWHYCVGFGLPLSRDYEVNAGADLASGQHYVSASIVARFGK